jgi:hypothetical protein
MASMSQLADMVRACTDAMVDAGLRCSYYSGWSTRSAGSLDPWGVICHHTASATDIDSMLANGRSDLPGPLCTWALHHDGSVVVIACGRANHAGASRSGYPSNGSSFGIEATGPWPDNSASGPSAFAWDEYQVMVGCICATMGWQVKTTVVPGHKESCDPPGRKGDPYLDMNALRLGASSFMAGNPPPGFVGGDDVPAYSQWSVADRKKLVEDVIKAVTRGEFPDGSKPEHIAAASTGRLVELSDLIRIGDVTGGDPDSHDYSSVEGIGRKVDSVAGNLDVIAAQVQALYDALGPTSASGVVSQFSEPRPGEGR